MTDRYYYPINDDMAKAANDANSFRDYEPGSAMAEYRHYVDKVYDIVDEIAKKKPDQLEKAQSMAQRYSQRLAGYYNDYYRNEASCPSIMISGGSNFPTKKKDRQNSRRDTLMQVWTELKGYAEKIEHLLTQEQPILSNDERAIEKLEEKLERLKARQEDMKAANVYYRKNGELEGCPVLTEEEVQEIEANWAYGWYVDVPFPTYALSNNNQNIHATEARLAELKAEKEAGDSEKEYEGFIVRENTEMMRLQIIFDDKPEPEIRDILKENGFRWAPSQEAWQRQLTSNARSALRRVVSKIQEAQATA